MDRNFKELLKNFEEQNIDIFKDSYDSFKNLLSTIKREISPDIIAKLNEFFINILNHIAEGFKFRLEFVIDTNILFGEIRAILFNKPSFLQKIIDLPFLKLFAPPKIKEELFNTIKDDLPREFDNEKAIKLANLFLEKIDILTDKKLVAWKEANLLLAKHDKDDVHFLALAISLNAHGIITKDKHFEKQNAISVWKLGECGRMASTISKGALSIFILDKSLNRMLPEIGKFFILFFQSFLESCREIYASIKSAYKQLTNKYSTLPKWLKIGIPIVIIAIPSLILAFSEKSRKSLKNYFINLKAYLKKDLRRIYNDLKYNIELIKILFLELLPFIDFSFDGMGYLFYSAYQFYKNIELLEDK